MSEQPMTRYTLIDTFCDLVNPALLLAALVLIASTAIRNRARAKTHLAFLLISLLIVYALKFTDQWLAIWPLFASDYSTHSAFALAMLFGLWRMHLNLLLAGLIGALYGALMHYQQYHTLLDMCSTVLVVGGLLVLVHRRLS